MKSNDFETPAFDSASSSSHGPINYVFEIHCGETVYYVGENPDVGAPSNVYRGRMCSMRSGTGLEQARSWETAIRQARLPLTTRPSANEPSVSALTVTSRQPSSESDDFLQRAAELALQVLYMIRHIRLCVRPSVHQS